MSTEQVCVVAAHRIAARDAVAVALRDLAAGERSDVGGQTVGLCDSIPRGHKFSLRPIAASQAVHKFGWSIGQALLDIPAGKHVHTHNLATHLSGLNEYRYEPVRPASSNPAAVSFMGYRRANGRVGTRNEIWILCTVGCVGRTAERIARIVGESEPALTDEFMELILATASGEPAKNERNDQREIALWKDGVTL